MGKKCVQAVCSQRQKSVAYLPLFVHRSAQNCAWHTLSHYMHAVCAPQPTRLSSVISTAIFRLLPDVKSFLSTLSTYTTITTTTYI